MAEPPMLKFESDAVLNCRTASGSNVRSSLVCAADIASSVED